MADIKQLLHDRLEVVRSAVLAAVDDASEHDLRRPLTPTGTNLIGRVKHLTGVEQVYFGDGFGRPAPGVLPWVSDGSVWPGPTCGLPPTRSAKPPGSGAAAPP